MKKKVFCDFDGTVAAVDVGNLLFETYTDGRWFDPVQRWLRGEISSKECLELECDAAQVSFEELERFVSAQKLDPFFGKFVEYCQIEGISLIVLSDGLDFYIERILKKHGYPWVEFYSNHLEFRDGKMIPEFPYYEFTCGKCANCKGYQVDRLRITDETVIYVGDGYSDRCGVQKADVVVAKKDLLGYCRQEGIPHYEFRNFNDVLSIASQI